MNEIIENPTEQLQSESIVDLIEKAIAHTLQIIELPLKHVFTKENGKNLYGRIIIMPKGVVLTSRIHKHQHQFVISKGKISVYDETTGQKRILAAPFHGVTEPGTRRALHALEETVWHTFHITDSEDPDEIVEEVSQDSPNRQQLQELLI